MDEIISMLLTYGPLGLWTAALLYEKYRHLNKITGVIEGNTIALTKVNEVMEECQKNRQKV